MDDSGDALGHCAFPACLRSNGAYGPMTHACPVCNKFVFCNATCYWDGISAHMTTCKNRLHIHKTLRDSNRSRSQSVVSPRSGRSIVYEIMQSNHTVLNELFERVCIGEDTSKSEGIIVWEVSCRAAIGEAFNWTEYPSNAIKSLFIFKTCRYISKRAKRGNAMAITLMSACEKRAEIVVLRGQKKSGCVGTMVAAIYVKDENTVDIRVFIIPRLLPSSLKSRSRAPPPSPDNSE